MRIRPEFIGAALALLAVLLLLAGVWAGIGLRLGIWSYHEYDTYLWVTRGTHVGHNLWWGEIKAGDNVETIIQGCQPNHVSRFGRWVDLDWTPGGPLTNCISLEGVCVIAKDGTLVDASYYSDYGTDNRAFFNRMTSADQADFYAAREEFVKDLKGKRANSPSDH
jgi:hypothetical protein